MVGNRVFFFFLKITKKKNLEVVVINESQKIDI